MNVAIQKIESIPVQKDRINGYKELFTSITKSPTLKSKQSIEEVITHLLSEQIHVSISRPVLNHVAEIIAEYDSEVYTWKNELIRSILSQLSRRLVSFEDMDYILRESLSNELCEEESYIEAADILSTINFENGSRQLNAHDKAEKYVRIAELYLQEDETVKADTYINRASLVIHLVTEWSLKLRYQVSYARILDSKRKFLEASIRYYELSQSCVQGVDSSDLMELLSKAVTSAILASVGPQRSRLLGTLYKDERVRSIGHCNILEKMYMEQLLRRPEIQQFEQHLMSHQKAILKTGFSVLEQAVLEHNMLAASKVYRNIRLNELGLLLEIPSRQAEKVAAQMISHGKLKGHIDQIDDILIFTHEKDALMNWDHEINNICFSVHNIMEEIQTTFPDLC